MTKKTKTPKISFESLAPKVTSAEPGGTTKSSLAPAVEVKVISKQNDAIDILAAPKPKIKQFIIRWPVKQHYAVKAMAAEFGLKSMQLLVQTALTEYKVKLEKDAENAALGIAPSVAPVAPNEQDSLGEVLNSGGEIQQFIIRWSEEQHFQIKALTAQLKLKSMQVFIQLALAEYKRKRAIR